MSGQGVDQARYRWALGKAAADRLYAALDRAFEDDGFPVGISEIDEDRDLFDVSLYAPPDEATTGRIRSVVAGIAENPEIETIDGNADWVGRSLEGLKPVRAGRFLVHGAHDRDAVRPGDISVEIEAGLAFGTGHHGTTSACLDMIAAVARRERPVNALDLGTGSGVLAIALALATHRKVLATDIDPVAVAVAGANARLNGAGGLVEAVTATGFSHPRIAAGAPFDLIVANILARPLMALAPAMGRHLTPGGSLILSGILARQRRAVIAAYGAQRFRHVRTLSREGWATIWMKR